VRFEAGPLITALLTLGMSLLLWLFAPEFARRACKGCDAEVASSGIRVVDLYSLCFVVVGLFFTFSAFPSAVNWLHYTVKVRAQFDYLNPEEGRSGYDLASYSMQVALGVGSIWWARKWAGLIAAAHVRQAARGPNESVERTGAPPSGPETA
jgi:hypothetical protein